MFVGSCLPFRGQTEYNCHVSFCFITHRRWVSAAPAAASESSWICLCSLLLINGPYRPHAIPWKMSPRSRSLISLSLWFFMFLPLSSTHIRLLFLSLQPSSLPSLSTFITQEAVTTQGHTVRVTGRWTALGKVEPEIKIWTFHHWSIWVIVCLRTYCSQS